MSNDNDYMSKPLPTGWVGWIAFAAMMMVVTGIFGVISGLAAIVRDETYVQANGNIWVFDQTSWGWIHLIVGLLVTFVGVKMLQGKPFGMAIGAGIVVLHMMTQFAWMGMYPWWSMVVIAIDVLILYALIVHGGEMRT
jgi:hypothetical protein